jgi:hypothetical protein
VIDARFRGEAAQGHLGEHHGRLVLWCCSSPSKVELPPYEPPPPTPEEMKYRERFN